MVSFVTRISNDDCVNVSATPAYYILPVTIVVAETEAAFYTWHKVDIKLLDLDSPSMLPTLGVCAAI